MTEIDCLKLLYSGKIGSVEIHCDFFYGTITLLFFLFAKDVFNPSKLNLKQSTVC